MATRANAGDDHDESASFLNLGIDLEAEVESAGVSIRERSKLAYEQEWLDARLVLASVLRHLQSFKSGVPGESSPGISERLTMVTVFCQGITVTERLISEGQYVKATAALKQDYELLTRLLEAKAGKAVQGKTPNVRHAPAGSQRFYGDLNDVAHPSNLHLIHALLSQLHDDDREVHGLTSTPQFSREVARSFYELHVWMMLEFARYAIDLAIDMYGKDDPGLIPALRWLMTAMSMLEKAGFEITSGERLE